MDFERMKEECPWFIKEDGSCVVTLWGCKEENCAPYHWVCELKNSIYIDVTAEIKDQ